MSESPEILISPAFAASGVNVALGCLTARVSVREDDPDTTAALSRLSAELAAEIGERPVGERPVIAQVRAAFRALGKDPSRYRPSSEALLRRVAQAKPLFTVNNVVDTNNLVSLASQLPSGTYDLESLAAPIELRVAGTDEAYEAIARGPFNLENLPVLYDARGPFGSPTSDSVRSMITARTSQVLLVLYAFGETGVLDSALDRAEEGLRSYCAGEIEERWTVHP
ncbi:MAG: phenylalanine--tRNA ligase beta subunit-related protein [Kiloniellales bacterium]|jgi:DNA/RNA-binding domain of Phe-tRNA-synthetase-like protein